MCIIQLGHYPIKQLHFSALSNHVTSYTHGGQYVTIARYCVVLIEPCFSGYI